MQYSICKGSGSNYRKRETVFHFAVAGRANAGFRTLGALLGESAKAARAMFYPDCRDRVISSNFLSFIIIAYARSHITDGAP